MKIDDLNNDRIAVYDNDLKRFSRFFRHLKNLGYIFREGINCGDKIIKPCVFVTSNHRLFVCEILEAVKSHFIIVPTLALDDFAEYERRYESEQEEKFQKILDEVFSESDTGQESTA